MTAGPRPDSRDGPDRPAGSDGLDTRIVTAVGDFDVDVSMQAAPGQVVAVLGPNGSGKSTVLRALAGLQPFAAGHLRLGGELLEHPASRHRLPAQARGVGLVPQESLLFPHLTVLDQVAFGPRHRGTAKRRARADAQQWLQRTGLEPLASRRPSELSGGQARRVAITRALAAAPRLLLLDEPLAALDVRAVLELRGFLHRHLRDYGGVTVLVTHDALDAMALASRLVVLDAGRVVQTGTPTDVARQPRSSHVAALVGLNLVRGSADGPTVRVAGPDGTLEVVATGQHFGEVFCSFSPAAVSLHLSRPAASPRNVWPGRVRGLTPHGDAVRVEVDGPLPVLADVTAAAVAELQLVPGTAVWASVKATEVRLYPA
jgi:molybdate transport system ATP-binding protein